MEFSASRTDHHDELRKLQDKVRRLEIQNEQLRSQSSNRNGLIERTGCDTTRKGDNAESDIVNVSSFSLEACQLTDVGIEDHSDLESWLERSSCSQEGDTLLDFQTALHEDINSNDNEFQLMRRSILQRIDDFLQVTPKAIDTRTFCRPKKRVSRPSLETMLEVPVLEMRQVFSTPLFSKKNMQFLEDNIDDVSPALVSTFSSLSSEPDNANQTFCKTDFTSINSPLHISSSQGIETKDNTGFHFFPENLHFSTTFQRHNTLGQTCQNKPKDQGNINATTILPQSQPFFNTTVCLDQDGADLNSTFSVVDGGGSSGSSRRSGRTASCESGLDEDQLSSASDSSYSSTSKPMNVGDVQIIAHIQEESLKHANSTPVRSFIEGSFSNLAEDLPSPIVSTNCKDVNYGYQSDHSDHSSADSRAKSSRSSVRSTPSGSPRGSTNLLSNVNDNAPIPHHVGLPKRGLEVIRPARQQPFQKPAAPVPQQPNNVRTLPSTGLRAPSIRPPRTGEMQPQQRRISGIPRPPSRLPAPRIRPSLTRQPTNKTNGMQGYY